MRQDSALDSARWQLHSEPMFEYAIIALVCGLLLVGLVFALITPELFPGGFHRDSVREAEAFDRSMLWVPMLCAGIALILGAIGLGVWSWFN